MWDVTKYYKHSTHHHLSSNLFFAARNRCSLVTPYGEVHVDVKVHKITLGQFNTQFQTVHIKNIQQFFF